MEMEYAGKWNEEVWPLQKKFGMGEEIRLVGFNCKVLGKGW